MENAEPERKRKESCGTDKTRKESSGFLPKLLKHRNLPVTATHLWSMEIVQRNLYGKEIT
eukprot:scaffold102431_cov57-Attheya_sp.AAC.2